MVSRESSSTLPALPLTPDIVAKDRAFALNTHNASYRFHVDPESLDLVHDHYGALADQTVEAQDSKTADHEQTLGRSAREFPDQGRGDLRIPAIHIKHPQGYTVTAFKYVDHTVSAGKPALLGLPSTWGKDGDVETLKIRLRDELSGVVAELQYSVFPSCDAITRSVTIHNEGKEEIEILKAASWATDLRAGENLEMVQLCGDWGRECRVVRRPINYGTQGFQSSAGYSSAQFNPFVAIVEAETTEQLGPAYGFNLVYTGSHSTEIEKFAHGYNRIVMGLNAYHLNWNLAAGESFTTPECVSVFSEHGLGGMSRCFHRLYRHHLSRSKFTLKTRPTLLNNWEATYFNFDSESLIPIASRAAELGVKLFVMDDGWFGNGPNARTDDHQGLGDWVVNKQRFPNGLKPFVEKITALKPSGKGSMQFGIWVEPEMVNPHSDLYEAHPDWALHAGKHERTTQRYQLVLNLGLKEVQDYIIEKLSDILGSANITYVKWDNNRSMHEIPAPSAAHKYMLGLYRVLDTLTTRFPDVLWEGCASGGGRFDAGILHYFCQTWTSDNTDGSDRIGIEYGTTLAYPPSAMGCHVSAVPNHMNQRVTPFEFRAHVAMMGGSFGFELDPTKLSDHEQKSIPALIELGEKINPLIIQGDQYRLSSPFESNYSSQIFVSQDRASAVLFAFRQYHEVKMATPAVRLQGLDPKATYSVKIVPTIEGHDGHQQGVPYDLAQKLKEEEAQERKLSGRTLMSTGVKLFWNGNYQSKVLLINKA